MSLTFRDLVNDGRQAVSILSNPSQSSIAAAGAAGVFSAEVNNLRKQAIVDLDKFGAKNQAFYSFLSPVKSFLTGSPDNPIPDNAAGTIFGLSYVKAAVLGLGLFVVLVVVLAKKL